MTHEPQQLQYTKMFDELDTDREDQLAAEEAIAAQLFYHFLESSLVEHACYAYGCALKHFPLPEEDASTKVNPADLVIALHGALYRWHASVKYTAHPTEEEATAISKELIILALFFLHPTCVTEVFSPLEEENATPLPSASPQPEPLPRTPKRWASK